MRELAVELKQLRMHGMAGAWSDLVEQGGGGGGGGALERSRWLLEHLLQAETTDRAMRSVSHQMHTAKFPVHRDLAGFDFEISPVDRKLIQTLAELTFTDAAHNAVLVGGPGTGKTHLATAIGVAGITRHGRRVRFYSTVDLANALEQEKAQGKAGRIAASHATHGPSHPRWAGLSALQPGRRGAAVPLAVQAVRADQRDDHDQPGLRRVVQRVRRREDDDGLAGPTHPPLPHHRDRQRELSLPAQRRRGQESD